MSGMWLKDQARRRRQWRGTRAHLKGRRPSPPTEWGVHNQLGSEASPLCFYYWLLCTTRKAPPSRRHAWLLRSVSGGLCASQMASPCSRTGLGCSITKASSVLIHVLLSPTCIQECVRRRTRPRRHPCHQTWGIFLGWFILTRWILFIPYLSQRCPCCFGFVLFLTVKVLF